MDCLNHLLIGLKMSRAESNSSAVDSMRIGSARNSTRVRYEPFVKLEFGSFKIHKQLSSTR